MRRTTITLTDELDKALRREAERSSTSISEIARRLLIEGLAGSEKRPRDIPWAGLFHDPEMVPGDRLDEALEGWADAVDRDRG